MMGLDVECEVCLFRDETEDADGLGGDLGADPVTGEDDNVETEAERVSGGQARMQNGLTSCWA